MCPANFADQMRSSHPHHYFPNTQAPLLQCNVWVFGFSARQRWNQQKSWVWSHNTTHRVCNLHRFIFCFVEAIPDGKNRCIQFPNLIFLLADGLFVEQIRKWYSFSIDFCWEGIPQKRMLTLYFGGLWAQLKCLKLMYHVSLSDRYTYLDPPFECQNFNHQPVCFWVGFLGHPWRSQVLLHWDCWWKPYTTYLSALVCLSH